MPGLHARRPALSFAAAATAYAAATMSGSPAWAEPSDAIDQPTPCWSEQVAVSASPTQAAVGHRGVTLLFALAGGADPCTLTGYPSVDSGSGGPPIHAQPTPRGYLGGLPAGADDPPTVTLSLSTQGQAVVEGVAVDADGKPCPGYTDLAVSPPAILQVFTVPAAIDACRLEVHPVTAG
ncbi:DUF4232 domain-containing protein [Mycobacterium sp. IEC1808]|uniref:DUF4232 domain-containing protein n=1 Tax=Mycobacterium sp. IEC1808 TaxID=1743230 RepID=UPI00156FEB26|nr:DUF4232 domain-containing protein [Mycobacterium sp. IEC1808]